MFWILASPKLSIDAKKHEKFHVPLSLNNNNKTVIRLFGSSS